jgi:predicted phage-related endonuclease
MLSPDQINARKGKLTASRIAVLMNGDAQGIMKLWLELTNDPSFVPEDLSDVWPVQLGSATELLNIRWYEMRIGTPLSRVGEVVVHPQYPWAAATIDAWDNVLRCPLECKHVGGREPIEIIIERYQPQMQWQMEVTGATQCAISVIMGANVPVVEYIERDAGYAAEMISRGKQFMACVKARREPVRLDPVPPPIEANRVYDMAGSNQWADSAATWREVWPSMELCRNAEKILKSLVPEDAKKCHGHGVQITRDRAGRLSLREATP